MAVVVLVCLCLLVAVASADRPMVRIADGYLRGDYQVSTKGRQFAAFKGIPFAKPPVGRLRFKEPQPVEPWTGVWEASRRYVACIQLEHLANDNCSAIVQGEEDCLYLSVYTPELPTKTRNPNFDVIFFLHPGAFMFGAGDWYGPIRMMDRPFVMVTPNFRLGALGFLSTNDFILPGNNGMKDQVAALKWVQRNIRAFGGNPDSVTITGLSAGGASVHYHYLSPLSRGLFHKGISQSGSVLCPWAKADVMRQKAFRFGDLLGCKATDSITLVECLMTRPAGQMADTERFFQGWLYNPFSPFAPVVERPSLGAFISKDPLEALIDGDFQNLPWMNSVTTAEGLYSGGEFIPNPWQLEELDERWFELAPYIMDYNYTVPRSVINQTSDAIRKYYIGTQPVSTETADEIIQMMGDRLYVVPAARTSKLQARNGNAPVYFQQFNYRGENSLSTKLTATNNDYGVSHGDDTGYLFNTSYSQELRTPSDIAMSEFMLNIWQSFARTGNPNGLIPNLNWRPENEDVKNSNYLQVNSSEVYAMVQNPNLGEILFWNTINEPEINSLTNNRNCNQVICRG